MKKSKVMSSKAGNFAKGGGKKMVGKMSTGTQVPGQTASMGRGGGKWAKGGGHKMVGKQKATMAKGGKVC